MLEGIYGIMRLLHEVGFVAEMIDVKSLFDFDQVKLSAHVDRCMGS